ncbi:ABC transporter substrate-binding protein [Desulfolucanica intricata]|uniref:ABC transporter substrate-binding protein n=1 Tax=Desulfolucanica intricata TaxID=1285191 RepID=UPI000837A45F|nr:ABC transporter substrate-binding protein [Desulfolucanica intricata]
MRTELKKLKVLFTLITVLGLLSFIITGCGSRETGNQNVTGDGKTTDYTISDPTGDWGFPSPYGHYTRGPGYLRMSFIFDTLVWKDEQNFIPALAKSWEFIEDENAYLFNLQNNVTWHDGEKFTAKDVVFTFNYIKNHQYQMVDPGIVKEAKMLDDYTVKLYLSKPYAPFLQSLAGVMPILPEHIWNNVHNPEQFLEKDALIGTGPYKLVDYNKTQGTYLYEANENYYQGKPKVERIKFVKISGEMAASALKQKQINAAQVQPEMVDMLKGEGFKTLTGSHDWVAKLVINHEKEPLNSKKFRQALAYAIDRQAIVDTCLRGHGLAGSPGFIPSDNIWYNSQIEQYPYNPSKTKEILSGLGYIKKGNYYEKNGKILELELIFSGGTASPGSPGERESEMIKDQLEKAGIKINLRSLEAKTRDNMIEERRFDIALSGHGGLGGDPEILSRYIGGKGFNSAGYEKNKELNSLLQQQVMETNQEKRKELVGQIQKLYAEEIPSLTLYYPTWYWLHDGQVNLNYTKQGIGSGVPIPLNKLWFVK